jgi:hypothetical protein
MQSDVLDDAVALVEDAEDGSALRHRGDTALPVGRRGDLPAARQSSVLLGVALAAGGKRERKQQGYGGYAHAYSGIQGS